jgi:hypothetical protein
MAAPAMRTEFSRKCTIPLALYACVGPRAPDLLRFESFNRPSSASEPPVVGLRLESVAVPRGSRRRLDLACLLQPVHAVSPAARLTASP